MFARTDHLLLRPAWGEDASALETAINQDSVARNLSWGRWPAGRNVEAWLAAGETLLPRLLVFLRTEHAPELVGGTSLHPVADDNVELDFWISPHRRGLGFATEAARAMIAMTQSLGLRALTACVFGENGAASRVLDKLGFQPCGNMARQSAGRTPHASFTRYNRMIIPDHRISAPPLAA
jgi:RimJ/RimL family protein N-acetyltransferase